MAGYGPSRTARRTSARSAVCAKADLYPVLQMTQQIVEVAKPLGISVHDHIIVGKEGRTSLKGSRLI
jgi:hypothetical protein